MSERLIFTVPPEFDGKQAKYFLKGFCGVSTRMITLLKREKEGIMRDGKILRSVDPVFSGERIFITLPSETGSFIEPVEGALDIAYEDDHLLILNKPPYMPVHPVKQHQTDTLANRVAFYQRQRGESYVFRAVNRLDRNTSGLVIIAKDKFTVNALKKNINKVYFALVHGELKGKGTVSKPIGLLDDSKIVRHVIKEGSPAVTHWESLFSSKEYSYIRLVLETGKTHQIRCHMSYLGHPLLGDDLYGGSTEKISRQALHCGEIEFVHPITGKNVKIKAAIPNDMTACGAY